MRRYLTILLLMCSLPTFAGKLTEKQAYDLACRFFTTSSLSSKAKKASAAPVVSLSFTCGSKESPVYLYNRVENSGYVVIAGSDALENPVVGWADEGHIDEKHMPVGLAELLLEYEAQLDFLRSTPQGARKMVTMKAGEAEVIVAPLIKTHWNQTEPFNQMLPSEFHVTGCTTTAMAQIMRYWEWPKQGRGTHTNSTRPDNWEQLLREGRFEEVNAGRVISKVDFSKSEYDWADMVYDYNASYTAEQANAVAKLMLDCNTAIDAEKLDEYGFSVGASPSDAVNALVRYFSYSPKWARIQGDSDSLIMRELDSHRPVLYTGYPTKGNGAGHSFVCDGYNDAGYFHFNFGWAGIGDGYYLTSLINPESRDYSSRTYAYIGIQPSTTTFEKEGIFYDILDGERACVTYGCGEKVTIESPIDYNGKDYTITKICDLAFYKSDTEINTITLPATLDTIGAKAFLYTNVQTIDLEDIAMWNNVHFCDEYSNPQVYVNTTYLLNGQPMTNLFIPATVRKVRPHFMEYNSTLQYLTFENGITEIGDSAFFGCHNLQYVDLPHTPVIIGNAAFYNGVNYSRLETVSALNMAISIGDYAFSGCPISNIVLNDSLTYVGAGAFSSNKTEYIDLPPALERIGNGAFFSTNLYGFRDTNQQNQSYSVHNDALYNKEGTRLLQVPPMERTSGRYGARNEFGVLKTTRTIASSAFSGCKCRKIIIPASVADIEKGAFRTLENLTDVTNYSSTPQTIEEGTFSDIPFEYQMARRAKLHVMEGCGEAYAAAPYWGLFNIIEDLPAGSSPEPGYDGEMNVNGFVLSYYSPLEMGTEYHEVQCLFSDNPVLTTDSKGLILTTDKLTISVAWNSEENMLNELVFKEIYDPTNMEEIKNDMKPTFFFSGNTIHVFGQAKDTAVHLYTPDGREVLAAKVAENDETQIALPESGQGTYILRVGDQSVKIQKR